MDRSHLLALAVTVLAVIGLVVYRLLWVASSAASGAALGRLPILPASWRRWLLGGHRHTGA